MDKARSQAFMRKMVADVGTALTGALVHVGDRTGLFRAMADAGDLDAAALAQRSGMTERYVEEWLSAMTCAGYVEHDPQTHRFRLPAEHAVFLTDPSAETYLGGLYAGLPGLMAMAPRLIQAFERGEGVAFTEFGASMPVALEQMNRTVYESRLVRTWLPEMPEVVRRLSEGGRALDVGCGTGVVAITLARGFPQAHVEGLDLDAHSIELARLQAEEAGVSDQVRFRQASADTLSADQPYDLITTFDVIHDLPDPVGTLIRIRRALASGGTYLMVEPKVEDSLAANRDNPFAHMLYAISCMHCVPQSIAQGGPGLGACWGPTRAQQLASQAGFSRFEALPIRSPALAFYALQA